MKNVERIEFCKVLVGNFLHRLCMPPDFVHQVIGELPSHVLSTTNSQSAWPVQLSKTNDGVFFGDGWKEFAEYHKLQENEFLFFTYYSGKEYLKVRVFATNRFERTFVFEEVKPEEEKEKVQMSCMQVNLCKSSFPKRRICSRSLEKEFVHSKDLPTSGSSHGMTYQRRNPQKQKLVHSGNCGSPATKLNENGNSILSCISVRDPLYSLPFHCFSIGGSVCLCVSFFSEMQRRYDPMNNSFFSCIVVLVVCSAVATYYEASDSIEDERHLKRQKVMCNGNRSSSVIEISDSETSAGDVNDNYCATKSGATMSSVENDYFDFVVKADRLHPNHFHQLYMPSSFYCKHLRGKHQVKICYGNDRDGDDFLVLKQRPNGGTICCFTSFCKSYNLNLGAKCRFEHVSGSVFKVWKINGESGL